MASKGGADNPFQTGAGGGQSGGAGDKKIIMLLVVVVVVGLLAAGIGLKFVKKAGDKDSSTSSDLVGGGEVSEVGLVSEYANPFERETQYVNPFKEYKSPFQALQ